MKFRANRAGYVTGIRFYKGTGNTGTHVGSLWTSGGNKLGSVPSQARPPPDGSRRPSRTRAGHRQHHVRRVLLRAGRPICR